MTEDEEWDGIFWMVSVETLIGMATAFGSFESID